MSELLLYVRCDCVLSLKVLVKKLQIIYNKNETGTSRFIAAIDSIGFEETD